MCGGNTEKEREEEENEEERNTTDFDESGHLVGKKMIPSVVCLSLSIYIYICVCYV